MTAYIVKDGDQISELPNGCLEFPAWVGYCHMCGCFRRSKPWTDVKRTGQWYNVCSRHTPMEIELWPGEELK